ncbi:hypothetical protein ACFL6Y_07340 [Elusimicrobiota bacterium]
MKLRSLVFVLAGLIVFGNIPIFAQGTERNFEKLSEMFSSGRSFAMPLKSDEWSSGWEKLKKKTEENNKKIKEAFSRDQEVMCRREARKNKYIRACLDNPDIEDGTEIRVMYGNRECRYSNRVKYWLVMEEDHITVKMSIYFKHVGVDKTKASAEKDLERVVGGIERYFASYGIRVELEYVFETGDIKEQYEADQVVRFTRSTSGRTSNAWSPVIGIALHEFGHLVGLNDEYRDGRCPERPENPHSIMYSYNPNGDGKSALTDEHIEKMLMPMCDPDFYADFKEAGSRAEYFRKKRAERRKGWFR